VNHAHPPSRPARPWLRAGILFTLALVVPALTHLVGVDWLLPPVILVATAGLLSAGRTLLDRLTLATVLLAAATCAAGLLFTAWPFGLHPVPVASLAFLVLAALHVAGREWRLPRPTFGDVFTLGAVAVVAWYVAWPHLRTDTVGRIGLITGGEDQARHVTMVDVIRRLGGYAFPERAADVPDLYDILRYYPSGWHLSAGLLDNFVRSSTAPGAMPGFVDHYVMFMVATFVLLALAIMWAATWIAGPLLTWPRRMPLLAVLTIVIIYGDLSIFTIFGFPGQMLGLAFLVVLVAIVVRPPASFRQTAVIAAAMLVGIGFSYHLYLPVAGLAILVWLWRRRADVVRHLWFVAGLAVVAGALASVVSVIGVVYADQDNKFGDAGGVYPVPRGLLMILVLVVAAAVLSPAGRRLRVWRAYAATALAVAVMPVTFLAYQRLTAAEEGVYYLEKSLHGMLVTLLVGLGALTLLLPRPKRPVGLLGRPAEVASAVLLAMSVAVAGGLVIDDRPYRPTKTEEIARYWHAGKPARNNLIANWTMTVNGQVPARPGVATLVVTDNVYTTLMCSLYLAMIQRTSARVQQHLTTFLPEDPKGPVVHFVQNLDSVGAPVLLVATTPKTRETADQVRAQRPDLVVEVLYVPVVV
jgi:hypothetical protein